MKTTRTTKTPKKVGGKGAVPPPRKAQKRATPSSAVRKATPARNKAVPASAGSRKAAKRTATSEKDRPHGGLTPLWAGLDPGDDSTGFTGAFDDLVIAQDAAGVFDMLEPVIRATCETAAATGRIDLARFRQDASALIGRRIRAGEFYAVTAEDIHDIVGAFFAVKDGERFDLEMQTSEVELVLRARFRPGPRLVPAHLRLHVLELPAALAAGDDRRAGEAQRFLPVAKALASRPPPSGSTWPVHIAMGQQVTLVGVPSSISAEHIGRIRAALEGEGVAILEYESEGMPASDSKGRSVGRVPWFVVTESSIEVPHHYWNVLSVPTQEAALDAFNVVLRPISVDDAAASGTSATSDDESDSTRLSFGSAGALVMKEPRLVYNFLEPAIEAARKHAARTGSMNLPWFRKQAAPLLEELVRDGDFPPLSRQDIEEILGAFQVAGESHLDLDEAEVARVLEKFQPTEIPGLLLKDDLLLLEPATYFQHFKFRDANPDDWEACFRAEEHRLLNCAMLLGSVRPPPGFVWPLFRGSRSLGEPLNQIAVPEYVPREVIERIRAAFQADRVPFVTTRAWHGAVRLLPWFAVSGEGLEFQHDSWQLLSSRLRKQLTHFPVVLRSAIVAPRPDGGH